MSTVEPTPHFSPGNLGKLSEEGRAFLQARVASFGLLLGGIGIAFYLFRFSQLIAIGATRDLLHPSMNAHGFGAGAMLVMWLLNRGAERSARWVHATEIVCLVLSCMAYGLMAAAIPQPFRPDFTLLLVLGTTLIGRSVYIPSSWHRSLGIATLMGLELALSVYLAYRPIDRSFAASFAGMSGELGNPATTLGIVFGAMLWWVVLTLLAASASAVIYGLRAEVGKVRQLGQYTLVKKIGQGGMGMVYEAKHAMLRRPTAIKLLLPDRVGEEGLARFEREVRATASLTHPNTIKVYDYGRTPDGLFYYAMEHIDGANLTQIVEAGGPLSPARTIHVLHQIAGALAEAHGTGLIHRDIKPDNVLLCEQGGIADVVKVVDFGLVKQLDADPGRLTSEQAIMGTPLYMAPEVIQGRALDDGRSDLYALGAVAYFLLTGEDVFEGTSVIAICSKHLTEEPAPPSVRLGAPLPEDLEGLVMSCLAKDPAGRPAAARALERALEELDDFGRWTRDDASAWWREHGPDARQPPGGSDGSLDTRAVAIDLGRRT